jgi:hypothetical protein
VLRSRRRQLPEDVGEGGGQREGRLVAGGSERRQEMAERRDIVLVEEAEWSLLGQEPLQVGDDRVTDEGIAGAGTVCGNRRSDGLQSPASSSGARKIIVWTAS